MRQLSLKKRSLILMVFFIIDIVMSSIEENVATISVQSVTGMLTNMPCNITPSLYSDKVNLVLWYKNALGKPLYSFDLREENLDSDGKIWANEGINNSYRAQLNTRSAPTAVLSLLGVKQEDAGIYRCRVDFQKSPTRYWKVNLSVIVPPTSSIILNDKRTIVNGIIGPFNDGSTLILTCDVFGGWPMSKVTWWRNGNLIDDIFEEIAPGKSRNTMKVETLGRKDLYSEFTCLGNNNNNTQPITKTIILTLNLPPLETKILWNESIPLSSKKEYYIQCHSFGAVSSAVISWWLNRNKKLTSYQNEISLNDNVTISTLKFRPTSEDHEKIISCHAVNPALPNIIRKDEKKLIVYYPPKIHLVFGTNLEATTLNEGDDVYFECRIKAFPKISKIIWKKDNVLLKDSDSSNILINSNSLVIQRIDHQSIGNYVCEAFNDEGNETSNNVYLDVHYAPICALSEEGIGVGRNEEIQITCTVNANPQPYSFFWQFNSSSEILDVNSNDVMNDGSISVVSYRPITERDYGTLLCWSQNSIGRQRTPCVFHVIPAGKPDAVQNCEIMNTTFTSVLLGCDEGYDGGLHQSFTLEVFKQGLNPSFSSPLISIEKQKFPQFNVEGLSPGTSFSFVIYSQNSKGQGEKIIVKAITLKSPLHHTDPSQIQIQEKMNSIRGTLVIWLFVGSGSFLLFVALFVLGLRFKSNSSSSSERSSHIQSSSSPNKNFIIDKVKFKRNYMSPNKKSHSDSHQSKETHSYNEYTSRTSNSQKKYSLGEMNSDIFTQSQQKNRNTINQSYSTLPHTLHDISHFSDQVQYAELTLPRNSVSSFYSLAKPSTIYSTIETRQQIPWIPLSEVNKHDDSYLHFENPNTTSRTSSVNCSSQHNLTRF